MLAEGSPGVAVVAVVAVVRNRGRYRYCWLGTLRARSMARGLQNSSEPRRIHRARICRHCSRSRTSRQRSQWQYRSRVCRPGHMSLLRTHRPRRARRGDTGRSSSTVGPGSHILRNARPCRPCLAHSCRRGSTHQTGSRSHAPAPGARCCRRRRLRTPRNHRSTHPRCSGSGSAGSRGLRRSRSGHRCRRGTLCRSHTD